MVNHGRRNGRRKKTNIPAAISKKSRASGIYLPRPNSLASSARASPYSHIKDRSFFAFVSASSYSLICKMRGPVK